MTTTTKKVEEEDLKNDSATKADIKKMEQEKASENRDSLREILRHAEIKRISERLTKKEVCNIYGLNYNFYMNCLSGRNVPSKKMDVAMREYLQTPTEKVYEMVFAFREKETEYHQNLGVTEEESNEYSELLSKMDILKEPTA